MEHERNSGYSGLPVPKRIFSSPSASTPHSEPFDSQGRTQIEIAVINGMTKGAVKCYEECVAKYASALALEASRLEQADRAEDISDPEITASMVMKSNDYLRHRQNVQAKVSILEIIFQVVAFGAAIVTPIFGASLHSVWQWTAAFGSGIIAMGSELYVILAAVRRK